MDQDTKTAFADIQSSLNKHESQIAELQTDVTELKTDVAEVKTTLVEHGSQIAELKADVAEIKTTLVEHGKQLTEIKEHLEVGLPRYFEILREDFRNEFRWNAEKLREQDDRLNQHEERIEGLEGLLKFDVLTLHSPIFTLRK